MTIYTEERERTRLSIIRPFLKEIHFRRNNRRTFLYWTR